MWMHYWLFTLNTATQVTSENAPTESECQPYIDKALKSATTEIKGIYWMKENTGNIWKTTIFWIYIFAYFFDN